MDASLSFDARPHQPSRARASIELAIVVGLLEAELWSLRGWAPPWFNVVVYAILIATIALSVARRRNPGIDPTRPVVGPRGAWLEATVACLILSTILMVAAGLVGDANETFEFVFLQKPPLKLLNWLLGKFGAALGQQLALQWFLWPVWFEMTRSRAIGAMMAASTFGLIHLPSVTLVAITLLAGLVWVALYQRSGRLAPLIASHMILATLAHGGLPERLTYDMRVGMTASADMDRFAALDDPQARRINRRLKDNRADLRHFASPEYYQAQGGTDPGFIRGLFLDVLNRPATDADVAFWQNQKLANLRDQMAGIFLASDEYAQIQANRRAEGKPISLRR